MKKKALHVTVMAYNIILLGEILVPDWDMFYVCNDPALIYLTKTRLISIPNIMHITASSYYLLQLEQLHFLISPYYVIHI